MDLRDSSLTITSRAEVALSGLEDEFTTMYCRKDFERIMEKIRKSSRGARETRVLPTLYKMLDACGISYEIGMNNEYYVELINDNITVNEYSDETLEDRMAFALFDRFDGYSTPSEYMNRIMVRLQKPEDQKRWGTDSLRLRILKQFIKYGNYLEDAGYGSRPTIETNISEKTGKNKKELTLEYVADMIDEDIFEEFDHLSKKTKIKPSGKYGLLKICDDLSTGKFRTNGGTKKALYMLAMVLDMTLIGFPGANDENDVIKNLFRDYYNNNIMRYMTDVYKDNAGDYENPSGQGVNFKNYAEMVYLYYIVNGEIEPKDKIKLSSQMIRQLSETAMAKRPNGQKVIKESKGTEYYRRHFMYRDFESGMEIFSEDILGLDNEKFKQFLLANYDCDTGTGKVFERKGTIVENKIGSIEIDTDQNTAFAVYNDIIGMLKKELHKRGMKLEECNYGLWFTDVTAYGKDGIQGLPDRHKEIDRNKFDKFMDVLKGADKFIGRKAKESESNRSIDGEHTDTSKQISPVLSVKSSQDITRTSILGAYYYYFNVIHEDENRAEWSSYGELFEKFKREIDPIFEKCGYQELSGKCMLDVVLTFSSYAWIVL